MTTKTTQKGGKTMENTSMRKKFVLNEIEKGNLQRAYEVQRETFYLQTKKEQPHQK